MNVPGHHDMRLRDLRLTVVVLAAVSGIAAPGAAWAGTPGKCAQLQDAQLAISSCTEFLDTHPESSGDLAVAYFYRGSAFSATSRFDEAIADLSKSIEADPAWPLPYNNRARAFVEKGEPQKAIADYDSVLAMNPANAAAYVNRALAYVKFKDFDHALADLQKSDELKPKNPFVIYNIGEVYAGKGDLARAEAAYRNALALAPANQKIIEGLRRIGATP